MRFLELCDMSAPCRVLGPPSPDLKTILVLGFACMVVSTTVHATNPELM